MIYMILAIDKNKLIGNSQGRHGLPWNYPEDLKFFNLKTKNKICVMGRNTYEQMGMSLKNRETIILSNDPNYKVKNIKVISKIDKILDIAKNSDIYICGGVMVFESFKQYIDQIYVTRINETHSGDVYYNSFNLDSFNLISEYSGENKLLIFQTWERNED